MMRVVEGTETVVITLDSITTGEPGVSIDTANDDASINLLDNDSATVSIAATTAAAAETGSVPGQFTVTQGAVSGSATQISYTVAGTATLVDDYAAPAATGTVTIAAGATTALIDVSGIVDDALVEGDETVIVTLTGITAGDPEITVDTANDDATVTIADNDSATVSIGGTTAGNEAGPVNGVFTVTQSVISDGPTTLSYTVGGTATSGDDYTALGGSVTILAGQTTATITVPVLDDGVVEGTETVVITLDSITTGEPGVSIDTANDDASINLLDNDSATVSIAATTAAAAETGLSGGPVHGDADGGEWQRHADQLHGGRHGHAGGRLCGAGGHGHGDDRSRCYYGAH